MLYNLLFLKVLLLVCLLLDRCYFLLFVVLFRLHLYSLFRLCILLRRLYLLLGLFFLFLLCILLLCSLLFLVCLFHTLRLLSLDSCLFLVVCFLLRLYSLLLCFVLFGFRRLLVSYFRICHILRLLHSCMSCGLFVVLVNKMYNQNLIGILHLSILLLVGLMNRLALLLLELCHILYHQIFLGLIRVV